MRTVTPFDVDRHHIRIELLVADKVGQEWRFDGVVDTGAPWTEFSDDFLARIGLSKLPDNDVVIKPELQTQKYSKVVLPSINICGHMIPNFQVMVSRFDASWGIGALVGLDYFRYFRVTIDYREGVLICEPL